MKEISTGRLAIIVYGNSTIAGIITLGMWKLFEMINVSNSLVIPVSVIIGFIYASCMSIDSVRWYNMKKELDGVIK